MTPIFKATVPPPPPHLSTPNEQREAVGLPRINEIEAERLPVFRQMIEIESKPKVLKCPSCGANITAQDMKCKYCGTAFYWEKENPCLNWVKENPYLKAKEMVKK